MDQGIADDKEKSAMLVSRSLVLDKELMMVGGGRWEVGGWKLEVGGWKAGRLESVGWWPRLAGAGAGLSRDKTVEPQSQRHVIVYLKVRSAILLQYINSSTTGRHVNPECWYHRW